MQISDYPQRIRQLRAKLGLTQSRLADLLGVSFASVSRWEGGQSTPSSLAWDQVLRAEAAGISAFDTHRVSAPLTRGASTALDFTANPSTVKVVAEGERLSYGHLFSPSFATETSQIDPLPHQRIAVYERFLTKPRIRDLLGDDAGAGKTVMSGLTIAEMKARRLLRRVLIIAPAGLLGNWERELRTLFNLRFKIVTGADGRAHNPFVGADSNFIIISIDTLCGDRLFARLQEFTVAPYDLAIL